MRQEDSSCDYSTSAACLLIRVRAEFGPASATLHTILRVDRLFKVVGRQLERHARAVHHSVGFEGFVGAEFQVVT